MADKPVITQVGGIARKESPEQTEAIFGRGGPGMNDIVEEVTPEQGKALNQREIDQSMAAQMPGAAQFGAGAIQGATFGLGIPLMIKASQITGIGDANAARHQLAGLREGGLFSAYGAGQAGGLVAGSVATGGLMDEAGVAMGLSGLLPEATGITGAAVQGAARLGFRGGVDGSLIGLGKAMEDAAIENKDLASEAVLAHMTEGALVGGAFGAAFGGVGGALKGVAGRVAGSGIVRDAAEGYLARRAGLGSPSILKDIGGLEDGMKGFMSRSSDLLESEGASLASKPEVIAKTASKVEANLNKQIFQMADQLDKAAVGTPSWNNFAARVRNDVVAEAMMAPGGFQRAAGLNRLIDEMIPIAPPDELGVANYRGWITGRPDMLARSQRLPGDLSHRVMAAYDSELLEAMNAAEKADQTLSGITGRYKAALLGARTMQVLQEAAETKLSAGAGGALTAQDVGAGGAIAMAGHPLSAASYVAGKAIGRGLQETYGPAIAEAVWKASTVGKIGQAVTQLKGAVSKAVDGLFGGTSKKVVERSMTRKDFNRELDNFYKFSEKSREDRINNYIQATQSQALAMAMGNVSDRAIESAMQTAPQAHGVAGIGSLRKKVNPHGLSVKEHLFIKKMQVIKNPLSVLDAAANGKVSKDQIETLKQVWPETYKLVVTEAQSRIAEMKATGKSMPVDKITQLSILLDSPLDTVMTKEFIQPVQVALNTVEPAPAVKPAQAPSNQAESESYETPGEQII